MTDKILVDKAVFQQTMELLMVATYSSPELQAERTRVINEGLKALEAPQSAQSKGDMRVYVEAFAAKSGWTPDSGEGAFEHVQRMSYAQGCMDALAAPVSASRQLSITKGERDGNWQEFDVNDHGGLIRVVACMEDDEEDLLLGKLVEQFLLASAAITKGV
jgi:hypothetical protein